MCVLDCCCSQLWYSPSTILAYFGAFLGLLVMMVFFVYRNNLRMRLRPVVVSDVPEVSIHGLPADIIASLPFVVFSKPNEADGSAACAICLSEFHEAEQLKQLPCSHLFHGSCIDPWLSKRNACPLCKQQVVPKPETLLPDIEVGLPNNNLNQDS